MKLSFKTILPIILISALLILLAGCFGVPPDEEPGYTPGTITGIIAAPCCTTSAEPVSETSGSPEYWCYDCQKEWKYQDGIEVVLTYGEDEVATVFTNKDGEFTFTNVDPGKNYVVTAYCPDFGDNRPLVKDVALELIEGGSFDTKITDLVSTSLGLVVDFLVTYTDWGPEDISLDAVLADRPDFPHFPKFKALIYEVRRVVENCELNLLTDDDVLYATCRAAEEISGLDIGCGAGYTPEPPPGPPPTGQYNLYLIADPWDGAKTLIGAGAYNEGTQNVAVNTEANPCYEFTGWTIDVGTPGWVTGDLNTEPLEVDMNGNVTLTAHFACPPCDEELDISIMSPLAAFTNAYGRGMSKNTSPDVSICVPGCATIDSVTVNGGCEYVFPLVLIPPYNPDVLDIVDHDNTGEIDINYLTGEICFDGDIGVLPKTFTIDVTYTNPCGTEAATGTVTVEFKDCSCNVTAVIEKDPYEDKVCSGGTVDVGLDGSLSSAELPATIVSYDWDFGDGASGTGITPSHDYAFGSWIVSLTVTDSNGCTDTDTASVEITEFVGPTAVIEKDPYEDEVCSGGTVDVGLDGSNSSAVAPATIVRYDWDFGDGSTADDAGATPSHDYAFGSWTVTLTVTDSNGCTNTDTASVEITTCINHAPTIGAIPTPQQVAQWTTYSYTVLANDPDVGDILTYSLTTKPNGMTIDPSTGKITWTWANCSGCTKMGLVSTKGDRCHKICDIKVTVKVTDDGCCEFLFAEKTFYVEVWDSLP